MLTKDEICKQVAACIVEDGWSVTRVTRDAVTFDYNASAPESAYWDGERITLDYSDWDIVHSFHASESITETRHVEYHVGQWIDDVISDGGTLYLVCLIEYDIESGESEGLGWTLAVKYMEAD